MTDISSTLERLAPDAGRDRTSIPSSPRGSRRKRSLRSTIRHHLNKMLRTRKIFRAGFVLLPLAGFIHVSLVNDVLGAKDRESGSIMNVRSVVGNDGSMGSDAGVLNHTRSAPGLSDDLSVATLDEAPAVPANAELIASDTAANGSNFQKTTTYVVNEGGSLWRTGKRFIDDEVLLDNLIDNLSESGMNVRSVSAGVEFIVNDLGSKGLLVVVEDGGDTYESRIVKDRVTSSVRRQAATGIDSSRTASR